MYQENIVSSIRNIFADLVGIPIDTICDYQKINNEFIDSISGLVGFAGTLKGVIGFHVPNDAALAIYKKMFNVSLNQVDGEVLDAVAELTNILAGGVRDFLDPSGKKLSASLPSIVSGERYSLNRMAESTDVVVAFKFSDQTIIVDLQLEESAQTMQRKNCEIKQVTENFLDGLLVVDEALTIQHISQSACEIVRYGEGELLGKPVSMIFREPRSIVNIYFSFPRQPAYRELLELRNVELTLVDSLGEDHYVSMNMAKCDHGNSVIVGMKDITDFKNLLADRIRQEVFVASILDAVPGGLLVLDEGNGVIETNNTFDGLVMELARETGLSDDLVQQQIFQGIATHIQDNVTKEIEIAECYVEYHSSPAIDNGSFSRVVFVHNVTRRHMLQQTLLLHSAILSQASESAIITDGNGIIVYVNSAMQTITGYRAVEVVGRSMRMFKSGFHDHSFYKKMWDDIINGHVWQGSLVNVRCDGTFFDVESSITPIKNSDGQISNYVTLWRDVTVEKKLQAQLFQAQKLEAIGLLAAGIAHEINTPIQYIHNNMTFIKDSFPKIQHLIDINQKFWQHKCSQETFDELQEYFSDNDIEFLYEEIPLGVDEVLSGVAHVIKIVSAMKEFSHPGRTEMVPTDINKIVESMVMVTTNEWKYIADLQLDLDQGLPLIMADPSALSQVLLNMIVNSAHAVSAVDSRKNSGCIVLRTKKCGDHIEIQIEDNGVGMSSDVKDKIFQPFFTTKEPGVGTGQGLAIVHDIVVVKHHGRIMCQSVLGNGACFTVQLPYGDAAKC